MKKTTLGIAYLVIFSLVCVCVAFAGCTKCSNAQREASAPDEQSVQPVAPWHDYDGVIQDFTAGTSHIQALHRQTMYGIIQHLQDEGHEIALDGKYQWRNSRVLLNDTVTAENIDQLHVVAVNDVFYYWDNGRGPFVQYINDHVKFGTQIPFPINDVWIEDRDMSDAPIKLSAEQALMRLKEWNAAIKREQNGAGTSSAEREQGRAKPNATTNGVLPKDCDFIILRLPVGPKDCNPQWVFGDIGDVLFIDAVTGEVRDYDPAFKN